MIVYQETKEQFLLDVYNDKIDEKIEKLVFERLNRRTGYSEYQTWMNSMQYMYKVLENKAIPSNSIVAIEYKVQMCIRDRPSRVHHLTRQKMPLLIQG